MDAKDLKHFRSKEEVAANFAARAWAKGIVERTQDRTLDLKTVPQENLDKFIQLFTERLTDKIIAMDYFYHKNKEMSLLQVYHIDETTSDEILANSARQAGIKLHYLPTYSYTKFFITDDNRILVDINTSDVNKRDAYVITENFEDDNVNFDVKHYEPEPGIDFREYLAKEEMKSQPQR